MIRGDFDRIKVGPRERKVRKESFWIRQSDLELKSPSCPRFSQHTYGYQSTERQAREALSHTGQGDC